MCSDLPDQGRLLPTSVSSDFVNRALGEKNKCTCNSLVDFYICKQFPCDLHSFGQDCSPKQIHFVWKLGEGVPGEFSWIHLGVIVLLRQAFLHVWSSLFSQNLTSLVKANANLGWNWVLQTGKEPLPGTVHPKGLTCRMLKYWALTVFAFHFRWRVLFFPPISI